MEHCTMTPASALQHWAHSLVLSGVVIPCICQTHTSLAVSGMKWLLLYRTVAAQPPLGWACVHGTWRGSGRKLTVVLSWCPGLSHSVEFVPFGIFDKDFSCKEGERVKVEEKGGGNCRWAHMDVVRQITSTPPLPLSTFQLHGGCVSPLQCFPFSPLTPNAFLRVDFKNNCGMLHTPKAPKLVA